MNKKRRGHRTCIFMVCSYPINTACMAATPVRPDWSILPVSVNDVE